jgi:hypothetical protein
VGSHDANAPGSEETLHFLVAAAEGGVIGLVLWLILRTFLIVIVIAMKMISKGKKMKIARIIYLMSWII